MDKDQLELLQQLLRKALSPIDDTLLRLIVLGTNLLAKDEDRNVEEVKSSVKQLLMEKIEHLQSDGITE